MRRNDPKQPEKLRRPKLSQNFKIWKILQKCWAQIPKCGCIGPKSIILIKFSMYPILKVLVSSLIFVFKMLSPNPQIWAYWAKKCQLSNLNKFCLYYVLKVLISNVALTYSQQLSIQATWTESVFPILQPIRINVLFFHKSLKIWPQFQFFLMLLIVNMTVKNLSILLAS